jgi:hypothetical protein
MRKFTVFHLKNEMLFANFISNVIGVSVVLFLTHGFTSAESLEIAQFFRGISMIFVPCSFMLPLVLTVLYERPIRRYLNIKYGETGILPEPEIKVRQRLLNEPFFLISLDLAIWTTAAVLYSVLSCLSHELYHWLDYHNYCFFRVGARSAKEACTLLFPRWRSLCNSSNPAHPHPHATWCALRCLQFSPFCCHSLHSSKNILRQY